PPGDVKPGGRIAAARLPAHPLGGRRTRERRTAGLPRALPRSGGDRQDGEDRQAEEEGRSPLSSGPTGKRALAAERRPYWANGSTQALVGFAGLAGLTAAGFAARFGAGGSTPTAGGGLD